MSTIQPMQPASPQIVTQPSAKAVTTRHWHVYFAMMDSLLLTISVKSVQAIAPAAPIIPATASQEPTPPITTATHVWPTARPAQMLPIVILVQIASR